MDAIVNAANSHLNHGGGVAAAIARAAGPELADASRDAPFVETGDAYATTAGFLPCKHVIHAVGPVWNGGTIGEPMQLASAYRRALTVAGELSCESVALPSISTGIYGFPIELAAPIALRAVADCFGESSPLRLARFCLFSESDLDAFRHAAVDAGIPVDE